MRIEHRLTGGFKAASEARKALARLNGRLPEDLMHSITLLVNELVTNAIRHGMVGRGEELKLVVDLQPRLVRLEVQHDGMAGPVAPRKPSLDEGSGWGLQIVEKVSDRWGFEQGDRTLVWFEIDLD